MHGKPRKYKHISWRQIKSTAGWIVQWQGKTVGGFHDSEEDAAETLRKVRGLKRKDQLELARASDSPKSSPQCSTFLGVCWHKGLQRFVVHDVSTGGTYATAREAAVARAEALGLPMLVKKRVPSKELIKRISFMRKVYMPVREGKVWLFADVCSAEKHAVKSRPMFEAEPAYEIICVQLKYHPWRDALLSAWIKLGRPKPACVNVKSLGDDGLHERACNVHTVLVQTVRNMAKADTAA